MLRQCAAIQGNVLRGKCRVSINRNKHLSYDTTHSFSPYIHFSQLDVQEGKAGCQS